MKKIVMIGTGFDTMGGIASVINVYRNSGLFRRFPILYIATHSDGSNLVKISIMLKAFSRYFWLLLNGRAGLLHVHVASRWSFWRKSPFILISFWFRIPVILHLHGAEFKVFYEIECGVRLKRFIRYVFENVDRVVVLSFAWKNWVKTISISNNAVVIYNPVILKTHTAWSERSSFDALFLGRLGRRKGVYDLLDATAKIAILYPQFRLFLGGDGELEQARVHADALNIGDKVSFLGWIQDHEKERHFSKAMLYVLPSYNEGLPMGLLEAMAEGIPILSTPIGGIPEAVTDGMEGFLIEPGDVVAMADRISRFLDDPELASRMGAAARRKAQTTFSVDVVLPQIEKLYIELGFQISDLPPPAVPA
jgi:glycosyltransferase involved in cell wall biosynthesis